MHTCVRSKGVAWKAQAESYLADTSQDEYSDYHVFSFVPSGCGAEMYCANYWGGGRKKWAVLLLPS